MEHYSIVAFFATKMSVFSDHLFFLVFTLIVRHFRSKMAWTMEHSEMQPVKAIKNDFVLWHPRLDFRVSKAREIFQARESEKNRKKWFVCGPVVLLRRYANDVRFSGIFIFFSRFLENYKIQFCSSSIVRKQKWEVFAIQSLFTQTVCETITATISFVCINLMQGN